MKSGVTSPRCRVWRRCGPCKRSYGRWPGCQSRRRNGAQPCPGFKTKFRGSFGAVARDREENLADAAAALQVIQVDETALAIGGGRRLAVLRARYVTAEKDIPVRRLEVGQSEVKIAGISAGLASREKPTRSVCRWTQRPPVHCRA